MRVLARYEPLHDDEDDPSSCPFDGAKILRPPLVCRISGGRGPTSRVPSRRHIRIEALFRRLPSRGVGSVTELKRNNTY